VPQGRVDIIKKIMDELSFEPFTLSLTKVGHFKRSEGNIYFLGVEENEALINLQKWLHERLQKCGFELEAREYRPHITAGRKLVLKDGFTPAELTDEVSKIKIDINKVDLMRSDFKNGNVFYTLVYSKHCNP